MWVYGHADCQVKCGEVVLRTEAKAQTTTPVWNQVLRFGVKKPLGDVVTFKVYAFSNEDKDELLGEAELTIADLPADETVRFGYVSSEENGSSPLSWSLTLLCCAFVCAPIDRPYATSFAWRRLGAGTFAAVLFLRCCCCWVHEVLNMYFV